MLNDIVPDFSKKGDWPFNLVLNKENEKIAKGDWKYSFVRRDLIFYIKKTNKERWQSKHWQDRALVRGRKGKGGGAPCAATLRCKCRPGCREEPGFKYA